MSLTSILKEIDRVNRKQVEVEKRYNKRSKGCPRQEDLQREEQEDQHIFGYSHSQMLAMFHQTKGSDFDNTRPCTAADTRTVVEDCRPQTALNQRHVRTRPGTEMTRPAMRRAQSAMKLGSYRQQFNFLFKEDIFDSNHEKMRQTQPLREQNCQLNQRKMSKMLVERSVPRTVSKMHSKSIKAQRVNFIKSFDENLARMQGAKRKKLNKVSKNQIFYSRSTLEGTQQNGQQREQPQDFFRLTKAADRQQPKKIKVVLSNSLDNLKELQTLINQPQSGQLADFIRESSVGRYPSLLDTNFITYLPTKFTLTCVITNTLQSVRLPLAVRNGNTLSLEDSRDILNLANVFEQLLSSQSMVHLTFHSEGTLLYQETLVAQPYRNMQSKEHEILLLMYYLKRFLLLDETATLKSVHESADLLLKSNIDLPDDFADFTETFGSKLCRVYDTDQRLYQFALGPALANGLASVTAFKKQMGFGQKVVKLKHGTREQFKKYLYNWEYFYICS